MGHDSSVAYLSYVRNGHASDQTSCFRPLTIGATGTQDAIRRPGKEAAVNKKGLLAISAVMAIDSCHGVGARISPTSAVIALILIGRCS